MWAIVRMKCICQMPWTQQEIPSFPCSPSSLRISLRTVVSYFGPFLGIQYSIVVFLKLSQLSPGLNNGGNLKCRDTMCSLLDFACICLYVCYINMSAHSLQHRSSACLSFHTIVFYFSVKNLDSIMSNIYCIIQFQCESPATLGL